jgi:hypothetical protein
MKNPWWQEKKAELVSLARETGPIVVYDEETLNDILFDLLSMENVDGLFRDLGQATHARILEAMGRVGTDFLFRTRMDLSALENVKRSLSGNRFFRVLDPGSPEAMDPGFCRDEQPSAGSAEPAEVLPVWMEKPGVLVSVPAPPGMEEFQGALEVGVHVAGLYLPWGGGVPPARVLQGIRGWEGVLDSSAVLVLGRGLGIVVDEETGYPDLDRTNQGLEALREAFPGWTVCMEPGEVPFSTVGVLLFPVEGEVQLVTHAGITLAGACKGRAVKGPAKERYLNARRICQVPL